MNQQEFSAMTDGLSEIFDSSVELHTITLISGGNINRAYRVETGRGRSYQEKQKGAGKIV